MTLATALVVRNTGATMNPFKPQEAAYYDREQIAYVMVSNTGKARLITSFGELGSAYEVGNSARLVSDTNGRDLGIWTVCAIFDYSTGIKHIAKNFSPALINRKLKHSVVK